jgi:hypothetical protein
LLLLLKDVLLGIKESRQKRLNKKNEKPIPETGDELLTYYINAQCLGGSDEASSNQFHDKHLHLFADNNVCRD